MTKLPDTHAAPVVGQLVTSLAGRDKAILFAVLKVEGEYIYLADGRNRKTETPKKKKSKHVARTGYVVEEEILSSNNLLYRAICDTQKNSKGEKSCPKKML